MIFDESYLASGHRFLVCMGEMKISCAKISGIEDEMSIQTIQEGGVNDRMVILSAPKKTTGKLVFEHGVGRFSDLNKNVRMSAEFGYQLKMPGMILVFSPLKKIQRVYGYTGAVPVKWSLSALDAKSGEFLIDKVEIMHQGICELPYA